MTDPSTLAPDLASGCPPLVSLDARPHNLPIHRSALIGREQEIAEVRALLLRPDVGLVTLIGPGGTGKTRLAAQVAAELMDQFADGVFFVMLAPIRDPSLVVTTIGQTLGIPLDGARPPLDVLGDHLREREMLLVLDNLEQVVDAASDLAELLGAAPRVKLFVTSRVALRLSEEHTYDVPPLDLPDRARLPDGADAVSVLGQYEAVRLFVERARAVRSDFALTPANAADVAELCRRLDGLPLAIELAAARVRLLPPSAILARLGSQAGAGSLQLLTGGARDLPTRQQTLRNTIAWSYDLLESEEQSLFRRLAIFVGGCTLDAVERVVSSELRVASEPASHSLLATHYSLLDTVDSLLAKSLLRRVDGPHGEPRFTMLETIREFGLESLALTGELAALQRWHAEYFLALAETAEPLLRGPEQGRWLDRLEADLDNLRAAFEWSLGTCGEPELALRLSGALTGFWFVRSLFEEGRRWGSHALDRGPGESLARVKALTSVGWLAHMQRESGTARSLAEEALTLAQRLGDRWWIAWSLHLLGRIGYYDSATETARSFGEQSLVLARELGDAWVEGWVLRLLGLAAQVAGELPLARQYYDASMVICRRLDYREGISTLIGLLGTIDFHEGRYAAASSRYRESLDLVRGMRARWNLASTIAQFAALAVAAGEASRAARLSGSVTRLSEAVSNRPTPLIDGILREAMEQARQILGDAAFVAEQQAGQRLSDDEAVAEALAITIPPDRLTRPTGPPGAPASATLPGGLSARELEVLKLMAGGATTREIAAQLVISVHTVESHITHVYQKIGGRGRANAAAYAHRHGLA